MATVDKNFKIKNGLIVGDSTNLVNYTSASPFDPFVGQLWISASSLYAWSSASTWVLIGDGKTPEFVSTLKHEVKAAEPVIKGQAVYVSSATGTNMLVSKASNITESMSSKTLGLIDSTLSTNDIGYVVTEGLLSGLNTNSATIGDPVWLGTSGSLIFGLLNKPVAPKHLVYLGVVTRVNQNNGEIFVHVQNGFELQELHNVLIQTASNNQILSYNSASSLWMNKDLQAAIKEIDGSGSGIDADLLDGLDSTYFMPASASSSFDEVTYTAEPPSSPNIGDIWVESDVDVSLQTYHAAYSASAPIEPIVGDLWVDSSQDIELTLTPSTASAIYLRQDTASAQYLTKTDASNTYFPISSSGSLLTETEASSIYAPLSSPNLTGVPLAPTAASGTNTTQIATTQFVRTEVANLVDSAPSTLDTLNELAAALGDDPNFATTITNSISTKLDAGTASALYLRKDTASGTYLPISATATFSSGGGYSKSFLLGGM